VASDFRKSPKEKFIAPQIARLNWLRLPLALRQRWWDETDYGDVPPSPELEKATAEACAALTMQAGVK
jgi:hypothetical protein